MVRKLPPEMISAIQAMSSAGLATKYIHAITGVSNPTIYEYTTQYVPDGPSYQLRRLASRGITPASYWRSRQAIPPGFDSRAECRRAADAMQRRSPERRVFGRLLRNLMAEKGLPRTAVATELGVTRQAITNYLAGRARPTVEHLEQLLVLLQGTRLYR